MIIKVTDQATLEKVIAENETVVVDFSALGWCIPCQRFYPHFEMASKKSDATFVYVDVDTAEDYFPERVYGIMTVPTVMLFKNGEYVRNLSERTAVNLIKEINE